MRFDKIQPGTLISERQRAIVRSTFHLAGLTQTEWAEREGLDPAQLSKMLCGHWVVRDEYAEPLNRLVIGHHPVEVAWGAAA